MYLTFSLPFENVSNIVRIHHLPSLFSFFSLQFQILNTVTMHALETLFLYMSLQFQIVSNTIRIHALDTLFSFFLLWLNFCVESLHYLKKNCIFSAWQALQNIKLFPSNYALKCPKMQLRGYRMSKMSEGHAPGPHRPMVPTH